MDKVSEIPKSHQKYLCLAHCIVAYLSYIKKLSEFILLKIWGFFKGFADPNWNIQIHNLFSLYLISADFHSSLFNVNHMQFIKYVYVDQLLQGHEILSATTKIEWSTDSSSNSFISGHYRTHSLSSVNRTTISSLSNSLSIP